MNKVWESNARGTAPAYPSAPSVGFPTDGDLPTSVPPTNPGAWWFHMITMELLNVIAAAGITPDGTVLTQLKAALDNLYGGGASALQVSDFTGSNQSLASPGYQKLPGGLIVQWGTTASLGLDTNNNAVTFPVTFPTACRAVSITGSASGVGTGAGAYYSAGAHSKTTTGFQIDNDSQPNTFDWIAIGN